MAGIDDRGLSFVATRVLSQVPFRQDCGQKVLLVEGSTDATFLRSIQNNSVRCMNMGSILESQAAFRTKSSDRDALKTAANNSKNTIVKLISHRQFISSPVPETQKRWEAVQKALYGLVDRDYDEPQPGSLADRLFFTDTHDLETLLLSTDPGLLFRLGLPLTPEQIHRACFLAWQLATLRGFFFDMDVPGDMIGTIACGSKTVDFSAFVTGDVIDLKKLLSYMKKSSGLNLPIQKLLDKLLAYKPCRKWVNPAGAWRVSLADFDPDKTEGFWQLINGHDLLQLLCWTGQLGNPFGVHKSGRPNRGFEVALIHAYDYANFDKTELAAKMDAADLLKPRPAAV